MARITRSILLIYLALFSHQLFADESDCGDGIDNDGNGFVDCYDSSCSGNAACSDFFFGNNLVCIDVTEDPTFSLKLQWSSANQTIQNSSTPAIGDIDSDGIPEIVTTNHLSGTVSIIDGATGDLEVQFNLPFTPRRDVSIAMLEEGDDACGLIFVTGITNRNVAAYDCTGTEVWRVSIDSENRYPGLLSIADFDEDGNPEVYYGTEIRNAADGTLLVDSDEDFLYETSNSPVAVDMFDDAFCTDCAGLELVDAGRVFAVNLSSGTLTELANMNDLLETNQILIDRGVPLSERMYSPKATPSWGEQSTMTSVADLNGDENIDVIFQAALGNSYDDPTTIFFWDVANSTVDFYQDTTNNHPRGAGRVNIGDVDGDGQLNLSFVSNKKLYSLDENLDEIWTFDIKEGSSGITGCTIFDFNGDGATEIVYRSEDQLFILDGRNGDAEVKQTVTCVSRTFHDYPIVADVDSDGSSEICIPCATDDNISFSPYSGSIDSQIRIYESDGEQWLPSRPVWNQHAFFNVNVNDDLTIPQQQQSMAGVFSDLDCEGNPLSFQPLNVFLNQAPILDAQGCPNPVFPDLEMVDGSLSAETPTCPDSDFNASFQIRNTGDVELGGPLAVSFYNGDPRLDGSELLNTELTILSEFQPGDVATLELAVNGPGPDFELWVSLNDRGSDPPVSEFFGTIAECTVGADLLSLDVNSNPFNLVVEKLSDTEKCDEEKPDNGEAEAYFFGTITGITETVWEEDFNDLAINSTVDNGETSWSRTTPNNGNSRVVTNGSSQAFATNNSDGEITWSSEVIDISGYQTADMFVTLSSAGGLDPTGDFQDWVQVYYILDGGGQVLFDDGEHFGTLGFVEATALNLSGSTVQFIIEANTTASDEFYFWDDVRVEGTTPDQVGEITAGFSFYWFKNDNFVSPAFEGAYFANMGVGDYSVVGVYDLNQCTSDTLFDVVTIAQVNPDAPTVGIEKISDDDDCISSNGELRGFVLVDGFEVTEGFTFEWTLSGTGEFVAAGATADMLSAATYTVTATDNVSGCSGVAEESIVSPTLDIPFTAEALADITDCNDLEAGIVTASVTGGGGASTIWDEDFEDNSDDDDSESGSPGWSVTAGSGSVQSNQFEVTNDGTVTFQSDAIDISSHTDVDISVDLSETGNLDNEDFITVSYILDGNEVTLNNGSHNNDFGSETATATGLNGNSLTFKIQAFTNSNGESIFFDNILITSSGGGSSDYTYNWYEGQTKSLVPDYPDQQTVSDLEFGFYTVEIIDNTSGCALGAPQTVEVENLVGVPEIVATPSDNTGCTIGTGEIVATGDGGTDDMEFEFFLGNNTLAENLITTTTGTNDNTAQQLMAGFYTVRVTNANTSCSNKVLVEVGDDSGPFQVDDNIILNGETICDIDKHDGRIDASGVAVVSGNVPGTVAGETVAINDETNGGFEEPLISGPTPHEQSFVGGTIKTYDQDNVSGWQTTSGDQRIEMWSDGALGVPAYDGNQFAEINANNDAALFFDLSTNPGQLMEWSFAHRGRSGLDSIRLLIGPPSGPDEQIGRFGTDNDDWAVYSGEYVIPAGQTTTRFKYEAISTANNNNTTGNFLDAISFVAPPLVFELYDGTNSTGTRLDINSTGVFDSLATGDYTLVVIENLTGCESEDIVLNIPYEEDNPQIALGASKADEGCDPNDGRQTVTITSEDEPLVNGYEVKLFQGNDTDDPPVETQILIPTDASGVTYTFETLDKGPYRVLATNLDKGCDNTRDFTVLNGEIKPAFFVAQSVVGANTDCFGNDPNGTAFVVIQDGSPSGTSVGFDFVWYEGSLVDDNFLIPGGDPRINAGDGNSLSGLEDGQYTVVATSQTTGCPTNPLVVTILPEPAIPDILIAETPNSLCSAPGNGELVASVDPPETEMGDPDPDEPYVFRWYVGTDTSGSPDQQDGTLDDPVTTMVDEFSGVTSSTFANLPVASDPNERDFTVIVTGADGCESSLTYTLSDDRAYPVVERVDISTVYQENFETTAQGTIDNTGVSYGGIPAGWIRTYTDSDGTAQVNSNDQFQFNYLTDEAVWESDVIDISTLISADISMSLSASGNMETNADYLRAYYKLDGGAETLLTNGNLVGSFGSRTASASNLSGTSLQLVVRAFNTWTNEFYYIDEVLITGSQAGDIFIITDNQACDASFANGSAELEEFYLDGVQILPADFGSYTFDWYAGQSPDPGNEIDDDHILDDDDDNDGNANSTGVAGGYYTLVVTTASGCASDPVVIQIADDPGEITAQITASNDNTVCDPTVPGNYDGSLTVTPDGPLPTTDYLYQWYLGQNTDADNAIAGGALGEGANAVPIGASSASNVLSDAPDGFVTVVITNNNAADGGFMCSSTLEFQVGEDVEDPVVNTAGGPGSDYTLTPQTSCIEAVTYPNGGIALLDITGSGGYDFAWYSGPGVDTDSLLDGTEHIFDHRGKAVPDNGVAPAPPVPPSVSGAMTASIGNLEAGQYTVVVTDQSTGCESDPVTFTVTQNLTVPTVSLVAGAGNTEDNTVCAIGGSGPANYDGIITVIPDVGNVVDYTWVWFEGSPGSLTAIGTAVPTANATDNILDDIPGGTYTVQFTNNTTQCTGEDSFTIINDETDPVVNTAGGPGSDYTITPVGVCTGGTGFPNGAIALLDITGSGGYDFAWYCGPGVDTDSFLDGTEHIFDHRGKAVPGGTPPIPANVSGVNSATLGNLEAGQYTVVVTDQSTGCESDPVTFTVTKADLPTAQQTASSNNTVCVIDNMSATYPDEFTGSATVTLDAGFGVPGDYAWTWFEGTPGSLTAIGTAVPSANPALNVLSEVPEGIYTATFVHTTTNCGGQVTVNVGNGKIDPTIDVSAGDGTDFNLTPNTACEGNNPFPNGGLEILPAALTGTGPYVYEWYYGNGIDQNMRLDDDDNIRVQKGTDTGVELGDVAGSATATITNLDAGFYTVRVVDTSNGCTSNHAVIEVTDQATTPTIVTSVIRDDFSCDISTPTGQVRAVVTTPSAPPTDYTVNWYAGGTVSGAAIATNANLAEGGNLDTNNDLASGTYTVEVINNDTQCSSTAQIEVIRSIPTIDANGSGTPQTTCAPLDGTATSDPETNPASMTFSNGQPTGFTPNYTYVWYAGETATAGNELAASAAHPDAVIVGGNVTVLQAGFYTVVVTETNSGCTSDAEVIEVVDNVTALAPTFTFDNESDATSCGVNDGQVRVTVASTTANTFNVLWYEGSLDFASDPTLADDLVTDPVLQASSGSITITDPVTGGIFEVGDVVEEQGTGETATITAIDLFEDGDADQSEGLVLILDNTTITGAFTNTSTVFEQAGGIGGISAPNIVYTAPASATINTLNPNTTNVTSTISTVVSGQYTVVAIDQITGCRYQDTFDIGFNDQQTTTTLAITHVEECPDNGTATVGLQDDFITSGGGGTNGFFAGERDDIQEYDIYLYAGDGVPADMFTLYEFPAGSGDMWPQIINGTTAGGPGMTVTFTNLPSGDYTALAREKPFPTFAMASTARCFSAAATDEIEQRGFTPIEDATIVVDNSDCVIDGTPYNFDGNGTITIDATKFNDDTSQPGDFVFTWFDGNAAQINTNISSTATQSVLSNLDPGDYSVVIGRLGQPHTTVVYTGTGDFQLGRTVTIGGGVTAIVDADDTGTNTLTLSSVSGTINDGDGIIGPSSADPMVNTNGTVAAGGVTLGGTIANGCEITSNFVVQDNPDQHSIHQASLGITQITNCNSPGGSIQINDARINGTLKSALMPAEDLTGYAFTWSAVGGTGADLTGASFASNNGGTNDFVEDLPAGTYEVFGTIDGCLTPTIQVEIEDQTEDPQITASVVAQDTSCDPTANEGNAILTFTIDNAQANTRYDYQWYVGIDNNGTALTDGTTIMGSNGFLMDANVNNYTATLMGVAGGANVNYTLEVIDMTDPNNTCNILVTLPVADESPIIFVADGDRTLTHNDDCDPDFDGSIQITDLTVNNSSLGDDLTGYTFTWSTVSGGFDINDATLASTNNGTNNEISDLSAGTYQVVVQNTNLQCTETFQYVINNESTNPEIVFYQRADDDFCANGGINGSGVLWAAVKLENGDTTTTGYSFAWYRSSDLMTQLMDGDGTIDISGTNGSRLNGASDDDYTLIVTDTDDSESPSPNDNASLNCASTSTFEVQQAPVDITIEQGVDITITDNNDCSPNFDGSFVIDDLTIDGTKIGDLSGYAFTWAVVSAGGFDINDATLASSNNGTDNEISGLPGGTYSVNVTNASTGCGEGPFEFEIEDDSFDPDIVFYLLAEDDYCATGGAEGSGGIKAAVRLENGDTTSVGYTFAWFTDDTYTTALTAGTTVAFSGLNNSRVRGLSDRTYYLRVTDSDAAVSGSPNDNGSLNCFSESFQVVPQAPVDITIEQDVDVVIADNDDCSPDFDGSIVISQLTINGNKLTDMTGYEFSWTAVGGTGASLTGAVFASTDGTNNEVSELRAGTYQVT
ncbi:MAG: hypothetical protein RJQ09_16130, partial [Cyclobacteriaceae bacterium]